MHTVMQHQKCNLDISSMKHVSNVPFKHKSDAYSLFSESCLEKNMSCNY